MLLEFLILVLSFTVYPANAIWPFPPKRFSGNSLLKAGSMGVDNADRIVAFGDFNGDQLCVASRAERQAIMLRCLKVSICLPWDRTSRRCRSIPGVMVRADALVDVGMANHRTKTTMYL